MTQGSKNRGAALIIAIAILAVLMAIGLAFYTSTRVELRTTGNVLYAQKAEHLANAGLAMETAFLNHDGHVHSTYTSIYHAWRTYWNAAAFAGKPWMWRQADPFVPPDPLTGGNVPEIRIDTIAMRDVYGADVIQAAFTDNRDNFYIPRLEPAGPVFDPWAHGAFSLSPFVFTDDLGVSPLAGLLSSLAFPVPALLGSSGNPALTPEQIHTWTDVDNDGDGLNDSMWLPIPQERFMMEDGIDNDLDGLVDEGPNMAADGIDNDMDGAIDEYGEGILGYDNDFDNPVLMANNIDDDNDGTVDELGEGIDEPDQDNNGLDDDEDGDVDEPGERGTPDRNEMDQARLDGQVLESPEMGIFVYHGGNDLLDNDRDGQIDEADEDRLFLTSPLVDQYGSSLGMLSVAYRGVMVSLDASRFSPDVDGLDNDYSIIVNDALSQAYDVPPGMPSTWAIADARLLADNEQREVHRINKDRYFPSHPAMVLASSGEPICDVVGRVAVLTTDEASKVNVDTAGGRAARDVGDPNVPVGLEGEGPLTRAFTDGVTNREYEFETIPGMGAAFSDHFWELRTGEPYGTGFAVNKDNYATEREETNGIAGDSGPIFPTLAVPFAYDASFPGYGLMDDDGDALWLSMNGVDDDGDARLYQAVFGADGVDNNMNGVIDEPGEGYQLGTDEGFGAIWLEDTNGDLTPDADELWYPWPEGVDEPEELRPFQPLRNRLAELDGIDNDIDNAVNEIGELGDHRLRTRDQVKLAYGFGGESFNNIRNVITAHSIEKNIRRDLYYDNGEPVLRTRPTGMKLNYNYSMARDIGDALIEDWDYRILMDFDGGDTDGDGIAYDDTVRERFALGLRQEAVTFIAMDGWGTVPDPADPRETWFLSDGVLRAYQLGASVQDDRDPGHGRTEVTSFVEDEWWDEVLNESAGAAAEHRPIRNTVSGIESIRINEVMARAVRRIEAEAVTGVSRLWNPATNPEGVRYPAWIDDVSNPAYVFDGWRQYDPNWFSSVTTINPTPPPGGYLWADFDVEVRTLDPRRVFDGDDRYYEPTPDLWQWFVDGDWRLGKKEVMSWHRVGELGAAGLPLDPNNLPRSIPIGQYANLAAASQIYRVPSFVRIDIDDDPGAHEDTDGYPAVEPFRAPNLVQFRFGPTPGLPPGRYYLLLNTQDENGTPTVRKGRETHLNYALKYGPADPADNLTDPDDAYNDDAIAGSILRDVQNGWVNLTGSDFEPGLTIPFGLPIVGMTEDGAEETGLVMLASTSGPLDTSAYPTAMQGYYQDYANTIVIPDYAANPADQEYLYVAVWKGRGNEDTDRLDNDGDGLIDENPDMGADGIDNDGNGVIDDADEALLEPQMGESSPLAINFFDFSQEPDHEWVEVVNVAAVDPNIPIDQQGIDLSGWQLEVRGNSSNEGRIVATIPDATIIAPGGSLLLGFNKFDAGAVNFLDSTDDSAWASDGVDNDGDSDIDEPGEGDWSFFDWSDVYKNGIGLARAPILGIWGDLTDISTPLIPNIDPGTGLPLGYVPALDVPNPEWYWTPPALGGGPAQGVSMFDRPVDRDIIDRDGNGYADEPFIDTDRYLPLNAIADAVVEDLIQSTAPYAPLGVAIPLFGGATNGSLGSKAWDRIVELKTPVLEGIRDLDTMSKWVLRGGIFPNYPEHDGLDNDGDAAVLSNDGVDNDGDAPRYQALYGADNVDNDLDGAVDEPGEGLEMGVDEGSRGFDITNDADPTLNFFPKLEGRDEGRPESWRGNVVPGSFSNAPVLYTVDHDGQTAGGDVPFVMDPTDGAVDRAFLGTDADAPDWKEFVERKTFPGDCVVVTLYQGHADAGLVADRITYTERDVINRSVSDMLPDVYTDTNGNAVPDTPNMLLPSGTPSDGVLDRCPYFTVVDANADGLFDLSAAATLDPRYPTMWPDNTMGADFYRSIERTHPLHNGDLFGTENRWDSTDGNYDDWADNMGSAGFVYVEPETFLRFWLDRPDLSPTAGQSRVEFGHALQGSPLRANFGQRATEGLTTYPVVALTSVGRRSWAYDLAGVRNKTYISPGDAATVPHIALTRQVYPADYEPGNGNWVYYYASPFSKVNTIMVGTADHSLGDFESGSPMDLAALLTSAVHDEIVLTCAQAEFYPITPTADQIVAANRLVDWDAAILPRAWTPLFLYPLDPPATGESQGLFVTVGALPAPGPGDVYPHLGVRGWADYLNYPIDCAFLLNPPDSIAGANHLIPLNHSLAAMRERWPLAQRAMMYVSSNPPAFDPDGENHANPTRAVGNNATPEADDFAAEALFTWDVEDGVENGEYDVFVAVADDLSMLAGSPLATGVGAGLLDVAANTEPRQMVVDAEFFADGDGDGRVWTDMDADGLPQNDELHRGGAALPYETFGLLPDLTPAANGLVHYGTINVQYNNVTLFLRNWAKPGELNRFSRIVLTPRQRTAGRININTATTRMVDEGGSTFDPFNPLLGLPGVLGDYALGEGLFQRFDDWEPVGPADLDGTSGRFNVNHYTPLDMTAEIAFGRPEWPDGRYYRYPSDLIAILRGTEGVSPLDLATANDEANGIVFDAAEPFREICARYTRMANMITTRSDVFEIIVTAQSGYGYDENGDGFINYRDDDEFIANGEKKVRTVYERREPEQW